MLFGPKGSRAELSVVQCATCARQTELFELRRKEKYCLECSADIATSILLATEIDAATRSGEDTAGLVAEFVQLGRWLLRERSLHGASGRETSRSRQRPSHRGQILRSGSYLNGFTGATGLTNIIIRNPGVRSKGDGTRVRTRDSAKRPLLQPANM